MRSKTRPLVRPNSGLIVLTVIAIICQVFGVSSQAGAQSKTTKAAPTDSEISFALDAIKQVAKDGVGNEAAAGAMLTLNRATSAQVPMLLEGFNDLTPLQRNWLMGAINRVVERGETDWPKLAIEEYFTEYSNDDYGRLVAFELMTLDNGSLKKQMIPEMWADPSLPLRYLAIADLIKRANQLDGDSNKPAAIALLEKALDNALDVNQIQAIAKQLKAKGETVDLQKVMGFVSPWQIVAGFDNTESKGFDVPHGPELDVTSVDPKAVYQDASGQAAEWKEFETDSETGVFDLNKLIGQEDDQTAYAYTVFNSPKAGPAEVRIGTPNAQKFG